MNFGSLFSGIGGIDLGLERAGMHVRWQAEIEPYCRQVLAQHWPDIPCYEDVRNLPDDIERVDLICGGFPCQDISTANTAGERRGLDGDSSGLWWEFSKAIGRLRPEWIIVENSPRWRAWVPAVRSDLYGRGYASVSLTVSAGSCGAPHKRPRCLVVAHADQSGESLRSFHEKASRIQALSGRGDWSPDTQPVGMDDGVSHRLDRLGSLGNAVVPAVAEYVGRCILENAA
jgi:DNA (cytosine-5)-methyltransferase 1